jgi:trk system potassium uptake protein TrkA
LPEGEMDDEARERALRQAQVIIAHHDTVIQANDHVIVFLPRKRMVREVEKLLQVSATFF